MCSYKLSRKVLKTAQVSSGGRLPLDFPTTKSKRLLQVVARERINLYFDTPKLVSIVGYPQLQKF